MNLRHKKWQNLTFNEKVMFDIFGYGVKIKSADDLMQKAFIKAAITDEIFFQLGDIGERRKSILLRHWFGESFKEIALTGGQHGDPITPARVLEINKQGLRMLRHPSRSSRLRHYIIKED